MPTERRSAPSHLAAGLLLEAPREPARAGLPACSRPAFTDPPADRLQSLRGFCHLKGRDQPFEAQLQTARVSFGEQLRITFVGPRRIAHDGTSGSRLSRKNPPSRGRRLSGERVKRVHEASLVTAPEGTEAAGSLQHVVNSSHSSSAATRAERSVRSDAGPRLHRETHVALFAQARLALDPVPINLSCHGSV